MSKNQEELSTDEILASIRNILWEKEVNKNVAKHCLHDYEKEKHSDAFELTPQMLAKTWDVPYEYADWDYNDVAARILHKYSEIFAIDVADSMKKR